MATKNKFTSESHWLTIRTIRRGANYINELGLRTPEGWVLVTIAAMITVIVLAVILK